MRFLAAAAPFDTDTREDHDGRLADVLQANRGLAAQLDDARRELANVKRESAQALANLRRQLAPLYGALQQVFGELDTVTTQEPAAAPAPNARLSAVWEQWKTRLGGQCAKIIDVLMLQPGMNTTQLGIAIGTRRQNVPNLISKLHKAGLLDKSGGRFSLKQL